MTTSDKAAQPLTAEELAEMRLLLAETRRRQTILAEATRAQADDVDSHAKMIEFDAAAEAFDDMADQDGLVESIARLLATIDAQAAKPPTVQGVDREKLARFIFGLFGGNRFGARKFDDPQVGDGYRALMFENADALISALPGLTPAVPEPHGGEAVSLSAQTERRADAYMQAERDAYVDYMIANPPTPAHPVTTGPDANAVKLALTKWRDDARRMSDADDGFGHSADGYSAREVENRLNEVLRLHAAPGAGWRELNLLACARNLVDSAHNGNLYTLEYNALKDAVEDYDVTEPLAPAPEEGA